MTTPLANYRLVRWMTIGLSLFVNGFFIFIAALALTNDDPLPPQGRPVLACLAVCVAASLAAWRWPRWGGLATLAGALALTGAVLASSLVTGLGATGLALSLLYPVPYFVLGSLSMMDSAAARGQH